MLQEMFSRPVVLCATRRQEDEAMVEGFDTDFVIILDPADSKIARELSRIADFVSEMITRGKKFYLTIDLTEKLEELSPEEYRKYIMWLHCGFYVTNFSPPLVLLYHNTFCIWCFIIPCCLFVAVPYRIYRRLRCKDRKIHLDCRLVFKMSQTVPLVLHCFAADRPFPGRYLQDAKKYNPTVRRASEINSLIIVEPKPQ